MSRDDFSRVADAARGVIDTLLDQWLPNGVRNGSEWCVGSRHGEAGDSFRIRLTGNKAGNWSDFASSDEKGGDLISLYAHLNNISQWEACKEVARQVGVTIDESRQKDSKTARPAPAKQGVKAPDKRQKAAWLPVIPVPDDAPPYPKAHSFRGLPEMHWEYRDQESRLLGVVYRFKTSDGGKEIAPCVYAEHPDTKAREWRWMQWRDPRPLYMPAPLRDGFPVVVVEGEKCADALYALSGTSVDVVSWPGGGNAVDKADWSLLAGRNVALWADADAKRYKADHPMAGELMAEHEQPGVKAMVRVARKLRDLGCQVRFIDIPLPGIKPDGWDVADMIADGSTADEVSAFLARSRDLVVDAADDQLVAESISTQPEASAGKERKKRTPGYEWIDDLIRKPSNGRFEDCRENIFMILTNDKNLKGMVALDEFSMMQVRKQKTPWGREYGEWDEEDDFELGMYVAKYYGFTVKSDAAIEKAVAQAARCNRFNPVTDWLDGLIWDGTSRLPYWLADVYGTPQDAYHALIGTLFPLGMVARAYKPGCQWDYAPVFEGEQGIGKTSSLRIFGGEWYKETPFKVGDKDSYLTIQGAWLYEVPELDSFNKGEITAVKAFITNKVDDFRAPYGRRNVKYPRRTCFCATTNQDEYLKDTTGGRRFWPIRCVNIQLDVLKKCREQLFAEAVHLFKSGHRWHPTREEERDLIMPQQAARELEDVWYSKIYRFVNGFADSDSAQAIPTLNEVTAEELLTKALRIEIGKLSGAKIETMRVSTIMKRMGWSKKRRTSGARDWFYARPATSSAVAGGDDA